MCYVVLEGGDIMISAHGYWLLEDSCFVLQEDSKYKLCLLLTGVSCAKLSRLQILFFADKDHYRLWSGTEFINFVHQEFEGD